MIPGQDRPLHVSAVVVSFDRHEELLHCLESLQAQLIPGRMRFSIQPELSVGRQYGWDNGTVLELARRRAQDPRIEAWWLVGRGGPAEARNVALRQTTADFLLFIDSDAWLESQDAIEKMAAFLEDHPGVAAVAGMVREGRQEGPAAGIWTPAMRPAPLPTGKTPDFVTARFSLWRRVALTAIGGFAPWFRNGGEDLDACLRLSSEWQFAVLPDVWAGHEPSPRGRPWPLGDLDAASLHREQIRTNHVLRARGLASGALVLLRDAVRGSDLAPSQFVRARVLSPLWHVTAWPIRNAARRLWPRPTMKPAESIAPALGHSRNHSPIAPQSPDSDGR